MNYAYTRKINFSFLEALDEVRLAFAEKGFGVVSTLDASEKIRGKGIDSDFNEYTIIGFCNPGLAYKFLSTNLDLGVFMPCSVAVYEKDDGVYISAGLPEFLLPEIDNNLNKLALNISKDIKEAVDSI